MQKKKAKDHYKTVTEPLSDVKWVLDIKTMKFVYVNQVAVSLRGYSLDEVLKQDGRDSFKSESNRFLQEELPARLHLFKQSNESIRYIDEFEQPCKDGSTIWVEVVSFICLNPMTKKAELIGTSRDIRPRKIAEQFAKQEQLRRALFIKNAPLAIIEWDKNKKVLAWNPAAINIFGYSQEEAIGKDVFDLILPENEKKDAQNIVNELLQEKTKNLHINNNITKSGDIIKCEWYNTPIFFKNGECNSIVSMAKDITKLEKIKKENENTSQNYQQLITDLYEGVCIVNSNNELTFVNPAFENLIAYKSKQLIGKNLLEYIPTYESIHKKNNEKRTNFSANLLTNTGKQKVIQISISPWRNSKGEIAGSILLIMDITKQKQANEELKKRYNIEKHIFNISSRFVDSNDFNNKVLDSLEDIGMLSNAENVFIISFDYRADLCIVDSDWRSQTSHNNHIYNHYPLKDFEWGISQLSKQEHVYIKNIKDLPDDSEPLKSILMQNNIENFIGFPIYIGQELYGFLGIHNIANQNWTSNEFILLRSAGELLCNSIQRKFNDDKIKTLNEQLSSKTKEIEQVLYISSHDIRSPLVNILGFTKELSKSIDELKEYMKLESISESNLDGINYLINEDIPEVLQYINAGGNKIDKLLNSLLKLSRLGRTPIEYEYLNSNVIVAEIIQSFGYQIESDNIKVEFSELPKLNTDKNLFTQIITNLIGNAIKYMDKERPGVIRISATENDKSFLFVVEDNGIGIPEEKHDTIFEIFSRLNPEHTEGEGIGLTAIKRAAERLEGSIKVESNELHGCTFIVDLLKK